MKHDLQKIIITDADTEVNGEIPSTGIDLLHMRDITVQSVSGLGREDIEIPTQGVANQNLSTIQNAYMKKRVINIDITMNSESARNNLLLAMPFGEKRRLFIVTKERAEYWIDVFPASIPIKIDAEKTKTTIQLIAPNPFFKSVERHSLAMQGKDWHSVENAGDAPAWLVWDFAKVGNPTTISPYTATDGTKKEVKWSATRLGIAIDPRLDVRNSRAKMVSIRRFGLKGTFGGLYINFEPGSRRCTASDIVIEGDGSANSYISAGYVDTDPVPHYTEDNYLPSGELDPKAEEAFKNDSAMDTYVTTVSKVFAPVSSNSEWLFLPPGTSMVRDIYNENTPTPHGTLYWYDTYSVI